MNTLKVIGLVILSIALMIGLSFAMGWTDVLYTKTVGKAKQNAERTVFEETQSYVEGKRQEALKAYKECKQADSEEEKEAIMQMTAHSFANFDENKLPLQLKEFINDCKYR